MMKANTWKTILQIAISFLTAIRYYARSYQLYSLKVKK